MRRKLRRPPPPTPDGHVLVLFGWPDGRSFLAPTPNYQVEADSARRLKTSPKPEWKDDPSYFWRRGSRGER